MTNRGLRFLGACLIALPAEGAGAAGSPPLIVRVCNFSRADNEMLSQAGAVARRIFQEAGIETEWVAAANPSQLDPLTLTVQIFEGRSRRLEIQDAFGVAMIAGKPAPSFLADVFLGNIEETANTSKDTGVLLGHVMAHEVGHLLLGGAHTPKTVMAANLGSRDLPQMKAGRVRFSQRQAERLRAAVALRQQAR